MKVIINKTSNETYQRFQATNKRIEMQNLRKLIGK